MIKNNKILRIGIEIFARIVIARKVMSKYLFLLSPFLLFLFFNSVSIAGLSKSFAQSVEAPKSINEEELSKRLKFYESIATLKVDFKQTKILKELKIEIPSEGRLNLAPPNLVIWEVSKPSLVRLTFDRKTIKIESGEGTDYSIQTLKTEDIPKGKESKNIAALEAWLQLDAKTLSKAYTVTSSGKNLLRFTSKDGEKSAFSHVEMKLASSGRLENLHINETSGDEIDIRFGEPVVTHKKRLN